MGKCVVTPNSMDELQQLAKENHSVIFINRSDCPHCHEMKPVVEEECKKSEGLLTYIDCPVDKKHCAELANAMKVKGVPFLAALPRGKGINEIAWQIEGSNKEAFKKNVQKTVSAIKKSIEKSMPQQGSSSAPPSAQPAPQMRAPIDRQIFHKMQSPAEQVASYGFMPDIASFGARKKIEFCVPNQDCKHEDFEDQVIEFYNKW